MCRYVACSLLGSQSEACSLCLLDVMTGQAVKDLCRNCPQQVIAPILVAQHTHNKTNWWVTPVRTRAEHRPGT